MSHLTAITAALAILTSACGGKDLASVPAALVTAPAPGESTAQTASTSPPELVPPPAEVQVRPVRLTVRLNEAPEATVSPGWPVVIEVGLRLRTAAGPSLTLANPAGAWTDSLRLECVGPDGKDRAALFRPVATAAKSLELAPGRSGVASWVLEAVDPASLPEGRHVIRVRLDATKLAGAVPTGLSSEDAVLTVAPPAAETPQSAQELCLARMSAAFLVKDPAKALAAGDAYLAGRPKDVPVRLLSGRILRAQDRKAEALAAYEAALAAAEEQRTPHDETFPIHELVLELRRELRPK